MPSRKKTGWNIILKWIDKIISSDLPIMDHFRLKTRTPPFSYSQYRRYIVHIEKHGRDVPPIAKGRPIYLGDRETGYLEAACKYGAPSIEDLKHELENEFGISLARSTLIDTLNKCLPNGHKGVINKYKSAIKEQTIKTSLNTHAGFELIIALSIHLGWPARVAKLIRNSLKKMEIDFPVSSDEMVSPAGNDCRRKGQFTAKYNRLKKVRTQRFSSIYDRRSSWKWFCSAIYNDSDRTLERKLLAMLSLPVVSNNGKIRNINLSGRQDIGHFTGRPYKQATIMKFMSELKMIGTSNELLYDLPKFWIQLWGSDLARYKPYGLLCFYIDGNIKPLWSHKRVKQGHVTMLGKVMGCLEHVFVHDVFGNPIYFETFSGTAPLNEYVQSMFKKIEDRLGPNALKITVNRALIVDAGANGVETLRILSSDSTHFSLPALIQINGSYGNKVEDPQLKGINTVMLD